MKNPLGSNSATRSQLRTGIAAGRKRNRRLQNILTYPGDWVREAGSELPNSKIQWVKHISHGFSNRQNFIPGIFFHCGGLGTARLPSKYSRQRFCFLRVSGNIAMAKLSDLGLKYRAFMEMYRYRRIDWRPGTVLKRSPSETRIAIVTSAAFFRADQEPFDLSVRGGDASYRTIPADTDLKCLRIGHRSHAFDCSGIESDKNLALPLDRLHELKAEGKIGAVTPRHFSLMGSISALRRLISVTAPAIAAQLAEDRADAVLLTPV